MSRILFVMLHPGFVRYYDDALQALAAAGHDVHVAFEVSRTKLGEDVTARRLAERSPGVTCGSTPERPESVREFLARGDREAIRSGAPLASSPWSREGREEAWESLATTVRLLVDYLRFFDPVFAYAAALRARAEKRVPQVYRRWIRLVARGGAAARTALAGALSAVEYTIPPNRTLEAFVREHNPDLLLVTPLVELGSQQVDYIKCARQLGIRSALCVASWDNLTSKGLIRVIPEHVVVWNEAQKREAVELHGVAPGRVAVTGAQLFDPWFEARPSRSREDFCRTVGLDPGRPFLLYVGSSVFIAPDEVPFADEWLAAVRASADPAVARLGVLIRPHPANARQWQAFDASGFGNVALWPPIGTDPTAPDFRRDYFDSLYYSAGVVGINTSAQIEAGIVGRPVFTVRAPQFAHAQEGTLHFQYLVGGTGLVRAAASLDEHVRQLAEIGGGTSAGAAGGEFVRWFVRPQGIDVPAAPVFARAIEALARLPRPAPRDAAWRWTALRPLAFVLARVARALAEDRPLWVYAIRPFVTAAVRTWALAFRIHEAWHRSVTSGLRRTGRRVYCVWYESSREARKRMRRATRKVAAAIRTAGVAAKRLARRAEGAIGRVVGRQL
ncbi:MAG: hypothetical protein HYY76_11935 [Acidobacteria bacterium]|nr:hypothetical protein [Acidobacteriota bacterium]